MFVNYTLGNETTDCLYGWEYLGDDGPTIVTKVNMKFYWLKISKVSVKFQISVEIKIIGEILCSGI